VLSVLILTISMVRVLVLSNFDAFPLFATCIYIFLFLLFIAPNMLLIYLFRCILCVFHSARVSQSSLSPFLLFSVLYFADKASKIITFLPPRFFCLNIFLRISWGCLFTERSSLNSFCLFFSLQTRSSLSPFLLFFALARLLSCS